MRLEWQAAPGAASYLVRRSESPDFSGAADLDQVETLLYEDEGAAPKMALAFLQAGAGEDRPAPLRVAPDRSADEA